MQGRLFGDVNDGGRRTADGDKRTLAGVWRAYTLDHDEGDAARRFAERYGRPPEQIIEHSGLLYVGPISEETRR